MKRASDADRIQRPGPEQLSLEPYVRGTLGNGFVLARMTLNLDDPGNTFDTDAGLGAWGLHAGGGVAW